MGGGWIALIVLAALCVLLPFFLFAPRRAGNKKKAPFAGRNFAHRGLYEKDGSIAENSLTAFARAAAAGYGIELDVQFSRDGQIVVFHDDTLTRVCGKEARVDEVDYAELRGLCLGETKDTVPLFADVLETVGGRVPIIVELKNGRRNKELCRRTLAMLRAYSGAYCVESFNPFIVAWFRFHAPEVLRGQLAQPPSLYKKEGFSAATGRLLGNVFFNFAARPHFIAYRIGEKPRTVRFAERLGAMRVAWTARAPGAGAGADAVIFEHYRPETQLK